MKTIVFLLLLLTAITNSLFSQSKIKGKLDTPIDTSFLIRDSLAMQAELNANLSDNIPIIYIDDNNTGTLGGQNISSNLRAARDPFLSATTFNFFIARFKTRGYDFSNSKTFMNGVPLENLDNGSTNYSAFSGLTSILRTREISMGLRPNTYGFGGMGINTDIDTRASIQRKRTEIGYSFSDGNYTHRWTFTHCTGINKKGWAFSFSGSRRWSDEGYVPGTYTNSWSYFVGIDKKISTKRTVSFVAFNSPSQSGGQRSAVDEMDSLVGSHYYNPSWGYQNGKKRNANVIKNNQPTIILTDEIKFNNSSSLVNAASISLETKGNTSLEYFNAPNPSPDYYKYLPSYETDPTVANLTAQQIKTDINYRQINWDALYASNQSHAETIDNATVNGRTGQTFSGLRSSYIIGERINKSLKANFASTYNRRVGNHLNLTVGLVLLSQNDHYYKRLDDLLGGQYYVDLNQYAIGSFPTNPSVQYPNLNKPNSIIKAGDKYGYDYNAHINKQEVWAQSAFKYRKIDFFIAGEVSHTAFWRYGNVTTGLYPNNSEGKSAVYSFTNLSLKGGLTYKINGKNYLFASAAYLTQAPEFKNIFLSAENRDQVQDKISNQQTTSVEGGYILNAPTLRLRLSSYYTQIDHQMNVMSFYNDDYYTYTNYGISNISKVHYGGELGFEAKLTPEVIINSAASVGRYYYNSRQNATTVNDNTQGIIGKDTVFSMNYRVANTPQEAYSLGIEYRSVKYWYIGINANYFDQIWAGFNPIRLTKQAVSDVVFQSKDYYNIINQQRLPSQLILNLAGGYSWKLPKLWLHKNLSLLMLNARISNLLDNKDLITYGGQQLRFEVANPNKFQSRYSYADGLTYNISTTLRF